jgi:hypothetical protein
VGDNDAERQTAIEHEEISELNGGLLADKLARADQGPKVAHPAISFGTAAFAMLAYKLLSKP